MKSSTKDHVSWLFIHSLCFFYSFNKPKVPKAQRSLYHPPLTVAAVNQKQISILIISIHTNLSLLLPPISDILGEHWITGYFRFSDPFGAFRYFYAASPPFTLLVIKEL